MFDSAFFVLLFFCQLALIKVCEIFEFFFKYQEQYYNLEKKTESAAVGRANANTLDSPLPCLPCPAQNTLTQSKSPLFFCKCFFYTCDTMFSV